MCHFFIVSLSSSLLEKKHLIFVGRQVLLEDTKTHTFCCVCVTALCIHAHKRRRRRRRKTNDTQNKGASSRHHHRHQLYYYLFFLPLSDVLDTARWSVVVVLRRGGSRGHGMGRSAESVHVRVPVWRYLSNHAGRTARRRGNREMSQL